VKDAQGPLVQGRTRWRRFAAVVVPAAALAGGIVFGMANGAIAAQFSVSGQSFKISAAKLEGTGFAQYGGVALEKGANPQDILGKSHPVATAAIADATLTKLCQSVKVPGAPVSLVIRAGEAPGAPAHATELLIDMTDLQGDATFTKINIGQDATTLTAAGTGPGSHSETPGSFGQQAQKVVITDLKQIAWSTSAGTFELKGLRMKVNVAANGKPEECFA
jgi:hypothetical protein